jgi:hypothetical protein
MINSKITQNDITGRTLISLRMANDEVCTLRSEETQYVMNGPTGRHTLEISETSLIRLNAHWDGYISNARTSSSLKTNQSLV